MTSKDKKKPTINIHIMEALFGVSEDMKKKLSKKKSRKKALQKSKNFEKKLSKKDVRVKNVQQEKEQKADVPCKEGSAKGNAENDNKKIQISEDIYLVISLGSVGSKVLRDVKRTAQLQFGADAVENQIMFLCCDEPNSEPELTGSGLSPQEILGIPSSTEKEDSDSHQSNSDLEEWGFASPFNHSFPETEISDNAHECILRQYGYSMFARPETLTCLQNRLKGICQKLGQALCRTYALPKLNVIFLSGIADDIDGGAIIDLGFMTRYYLNKLLPFCNESINYYAYLFLPSTFSTNSEYKFSERDVKAYAALKEIDYFMHLKHSGDVFALNYNITSLYGIDFKDNLFDYCTLIEGVDKSESSYEKAGDVLRDVTTLTFMKQESDYYYSRKDFDDSTIASSKWNRERSGFNYHLMRQRDEICPREANYSFNIISYSSCDVPVETKDSSEMPVCELLKKLRNNETVLASIRPEFSLFECTYTSILIIPVKYHSLVYDIKTYLDKHRLWYDYKLNSEDIISCAFTDKIILIRKYMGVPAWALTWTSQAESLYEKEGLDRTGIHIKRSPGYQDWSEIPNLIPEIVLTDEERNSRDREIQFLQSIKSDMKEARERGLLIPSEPFYELLRFDPRETAETLWDDLRIQKSQKHTTAQMFEILVRLNKAHYSMLECKTIQLGYDFLLSEEEKKEFAFSMSCKAVLKNRKEREELRRSLEIGRNLIFRLEELYKE